MQAPAFLRRPRGDAVLEHHLAAILPHPHGRQRQLRQLAGQRREFVEMRGEDGPAAHPVVQRLKHRPGDGEPIPGGGAAPHLIQHHQGLRAGEVQDRRRLRHLHHEGGAPARQVIRRADSGEQPVHQADPRGFRRDEEAGLGEDHEQRVLPQEGGFAGHVRPGQQADAPAGRKLRVVRDEGPGPAAGQRRGHHRVAAGGDREFRAFAEYWPAPAILGGEFGGGGLHIHRRQRRGGGGDPGGGGEA